METILARCAGLDVHKESVEACVRRIEPDGRVHSETRHWGRRLVISDYFLNEDSFGKVHAEGDHKIHVAKVNDSSLVLDSRFQLDFNTAFRTGPARPHGLAMK